MNKKSGRRRRKLVELDEGGLKALFTLDGGGAGNTDVMLF